ncbi:MAG: putative cytochromre c biosis protein CcmI [Pseudomonadota bacterium]
MSATIEQLKQQIQQLDDLVRSGALSGEQAAEARAKLEKQLVEAVMAGAGQAAAPAAASPVAQAAAAASAPSEPEAKASGKLIAAMTAFVLVVGVVGYRLVGQPDALGVGPGGDNGAALAKSGGGDSHTMNAQDVEGMIQQLAAKLEKEPNNAEGWGMLGRSYAAMDRFKEAVDAYRKGLKIKPEDAEILADYADALGMLNGRKLDGEPAEAVAKALKVDPNNFKALSLGGTIAFDRQDYKEAVALWTRAVERAPADNPPLAQQLREALAEARQRAGMAPDPQLSPQTAAAGGPHVSGTITLSPAVASQVQPDDTVFIFARSVNGPKVPLAIVRKQVKDLPFAFTLDDSQSMSPQFKISGAQQVVIAARISRTGEAMPQNGDLAGESATVAVGSDGVQVEIAHPITVNR